MAQPRITSDRDDIETWADEHDAVPVREGGEIRLVRERDVTTDHERLDWDTFHREVDDEDRVVAYYGETEDREPFEMTDRSAALERVESDDLDREEAERQLIEGETITGTVTETTVIEETIVEEATVESEVVDRETVERNVVDIELLGRECQTCDVTAEDTDFDYVGAYGTERFLADDETTGLAGNYDEHPFDVTVEVQEDWKATIEQLDRYTVRTDVTDVNVTGTEEVEGRDVDVDIDADAVHRQLLSGDVIDVDADVSEGEVVDTETYDIESEFTGDDTLTTYLTARRLSEREITERSRLTTEVVDGELLDRETTSERTVESGLVERDAAAVEADTDLETDDEEVRFMPTEDDEGKPVVDASGDKVGEVMDVSDGVAFVDPHPSIAEKIMSRLGADEDDEYYRLREDRITRITDDEVVVSTDEFAEDAR
ncbi:MULTISPECIES: hypothetical protein [Halorussus]|uniref:hypothetical protein n=1 Tax=Halorussus TaxID=1070314 RepID=UPI00209F2055|nr:hypothetical protein [Halorussus vallis]USZ74909.1 hypothetical protein NGM07_15895 [Halorussus vallis]